MNLFLIHIPADLNSKPHFYHSYEVREKKKKKKNGWMDILGCYPYIIKLFKYYRLFLKRCQLALFRILLLLLVISSLVGYRHGNYIFIDGLEHEPTSCSAFINLLSFMMAQWVKPCSFCCIHDPACSKCVISHFSDFIRPSCILSYSSHHFT